MLTVAPRVTDAAQQLADAIDEEFLAYVDAGGLPHEHIDVERIRACVERLRREIGSHDAAREDEARAKARQALRDGSEQAQIEDDSRVVFLDDPDATGVAVEAWVYVMEAETS